MTTISHIIIITRRKVTTLNQFMETTVLLFCTVKYAFPSEVLLTSIYSLWSHNANWAKNGK